MKVGYLGLFQRDLYRISCLDILLGTAQASIVVVCCLMTPASQQVWVTCSESNTAAGRWCMQTIARCPVVFCPVAPIRSLADQNRTFLSSQPTVVFHHHPSVIIYATLSSFWWLYLWLLFSILSVSMCLVEALLRRFRRQPVPIPSRTAASFARPVYWAFGLRFFFTFFFTLTYSYL